MEGLRRRNVRLDSYTCKMCGEEEETVDHLFVGCQLTLAVWDFIADWTRCPRLFAFTVKDIINLHNNVRGSRRWKQLLHLIILVALWGIWRCRNDRVFNDREPNFEGQKQEIQQSGFLWFKNRVKRHSVTWVQ
ncbi:uncharacterized protein LOC110880582 [Helianthus annuus]|uniref:uncharacterized protein LOC110880582 n=1 Tax=Helianthus annuus TaxID=4232 RepID=UPI000B9002C1|nr:uncharacterized protein LOC110880582 [Helianthus annuus]